MRVAVTIRGRVTEFPIKEDFPPKMCIASGTQLDPRARMATQFAGATDKINANTHIHTGASIGKITDIIQKIL